MELNTSTAETSLTDDETQRKQRTQQCVWPLRQLRIFLAFVACVALNGDSAEPQVFLSVVVYNLRRPLTCTAVHSGQISDGAPGTIYSTQRIDLTVRLLLCLHKTRHTT